MEGFQCPAKKFQCNVCHNFGHFTSLCFQKKEAPSCPEDQRHINYKQEQCMHKRKPFVATLKITVPVMTPSACRSRCRTHKPVQRRFPHQLISLLILSTYCSPIIPGINTSEQDWTPVQMSTLCPPVYTACYLKIQSWRSLTLATWKLELTVKMQSSS